MSDKKLDSMSWREYRAYLDAGAPKRKPIDPSLHITSKGVWYGKNGRLLFSKTYQKNYNAWRNKLNITKDTNEVRREFLRFFGKLKTATRGSGPKDLIKEDANKGATKAAAERRLHEAIELPATMEQGTRRRIKQRGPRESYYQELLDKSTKADIRFQATGLQRDMDSATYHRRRLTEFEKEARKSGKWKTGRGWFKGEVLKLKTSMQMVTKRILRTFGYGYKSTDRIKKYGKRDSIDVILDEPKRKKRRSWEA